MIYSNIVYETNFDANFLDGNWNMFYTLVQSRKNLKGIKEQRELTFKKISNKNYESAYKEFMTEVWADLSTYYMDLFNMPDSAYIYLKERLENGKTKDNQITKD
jgi:hypothetical protein